MSSEVARVYRDILKAVVKHVGRDDHKSISPTLSSTSYKINLGINVILFVASISISTCVF